LVRWTAPAANGSAITGYSVRVVNPANVQVGALRPAAAGATSLNVTGLTNGTAYRFQVQATNGAGTGPFSALSVAVTPRTEFVAPTVTARTPANGARSVSQTANVTATFSEPVTGVSATTFVLRLGTTVIPAVVTFNATTRVATLNPNATLLADRTYTATLSGINDIAGNPMVASTWSFLTGPAPTIGATVPAAGATGVRRNANLSANFSELITGFSTANVQITRVSNGVAVPVRLAFNTTTRNLIINPETAAGVNVTLAANVQYRVTITGGNTAVRDLAGNPLVTRTWTFTTGTLL